jgi:hypothetical protein
MPSSSVPSFIVRVDSPQPLKYNAIMPTSNSRSRRSNFEFPLAGTSNTHRVTLLILLTITACLVGCTKSTAPTELTAIQGNWQFDEAAHLESMRARFTDPGELQKMVDLYEFAKKNGTPVMTDITISGSCITTRRGLLRQQYDLSDWQTDGGRIVAKALWHEDRNDPGDATTIDVVLQTDGTNLSFTLSDEGSGQTYAFRRK